MSDDLGERWVIVSPLGVLDFTLSSDEQYSWLTWARDQSCSQDNWQLEQIAQAKERGFEAVKVKLMRVTE